MSDITLPPRAHMLLPAPGRLYGIARVLPSERELLPREFEVHGVIEYGATGIIRRYEGTAHRRGRRAFTFTIYPEGRRKRGRERRRKRKGKTATRPAFGVGGA